MTESSFASPSSGISLSTEPSREAPAMLAANVENTQCSNVGKPNNTNEVVTGSPLVTVLMPCLNESRTLGACIEEAHAGCRVALDMRNGRSDAIEYEILIADNGSTDGSPEIAVQHGARVVHVAQKGYGAALRGGIAAARGEYIVMGDSDCSYDFGEVPRFLDKLEEGFDLVVGNRFAGGIMPGAMPWHHRYIGNPLLSGLGRLLYGSRCCDWHCGLRGCNRKEILKINLSTVGMELASEMIIGATVRRLRVGEHPVKLRVDGRNRRPHLNSMRDGLRHLRQLLSLSFINHCNIRR